MINRFFLSALAAICLGATAQAQVYIINSGSSTFAPSFRGGIDTTWFGWGSGSFDGSTNNERIDNPVATLGTTTTGYSLTQIEDIDILASSNNIYTGLNGVGQTANLTLVIPVTGGDGGFTTIIIQGIGSVTGMGTPVLPSLGSINGISPTFVNGVNTANGLQWWAKYEITGNLDSYSVNILLPGGGNPVSVTNLVVDTQWSSTGFAPDTAQAVPEPSTYALLGLSLGVAVWQIRRRRHCS